MIKTEKIVTVSTELRGEDANTVIRGSYNDVVNLTVNLLTKVSEVLAGDKDDQLQILRVLYLTARDVIVNQAK